MKPTVLLSVICALGLVLSGPSPAFAHGAGYRRSNKGAMALEFYYSTGEPMAYQEARVYSPTDARAAFQSGRTDEFGRVSFVPAASGDWRVEVRDEEGHRAEAVVTVTEDSDTGAEKNGVAALSGTSLPRGGELFLRALLGVSLIFNLAALILISRIKKRGAGSCT